MASCPIWARSTRDRDMVFCWNGTTSGVRVPDGDWIKRRPPGAHASATRPRPRSPWSCPGTSSMSSPGPGRRCWAARPRTACSRSRPRAVERLESYKPAWPLPKIFRLTKGGKLIEGIFKGETINTPSMLAVEDALDGLRWAEAHRRPAGADRALRGQPRGDRRLGRAHALGRLPGQAPPRSARRPRSACNRRSGVRCLDTAAGEHRQADGCWPSEGVAYDIGATATPRRACASGAAPRSRPPTSRRLLPWLDWAFARSGARNAEAVTGVEGLVERHAEGADRRRAEPARRGDLPRARRRGRGPHRPEGARARAGHRRV